MTTKSIRDYINLVETAMTESKNKQDFEHHRDMAKLATDPGRRAIHAAKATKAGQRWDNEKKKPKTNQDVAEGQDQEVTHNGEVIGHTWNQGREVHGEHSKSGMSWAGGNHASMAQHLKNHHDSWVKDQARKQSLKKQDVAEDQLDETSPEAIAKIEQLRQK